MRNSCICFAVWLLVASAAPAQEVIRERFRESATLKTDHAIARKIGSVQDYLKQGEWEEAIEFLQQIAGQHDETLVEVSPGLYLNVRLYGNMLLAALPAEGLKIYRRQVDPLARQEFQAAGYNPEALQQLLEKAFASSVGDEALLRLGEICWERGDVATARHYWQQLLPGEKPAAGEFQVRLLRYPDAEISPAEVRARLILCDLALGDDEQAARNLTQFKEAFPEEKGKLAGREGNLAEILAAVEREARDWRLPPGNGTMQTFALNPQRNKVLPRPVDVGSVRWSAALTPVQFITPHPLRPADWGEHPLTTFPIIVGEWLLANDSSEIRAYKLTTGEERRLYPDIQRPHDMLNGVSKGVGRYTLTAAEGNLYARMGLPVTNRSNRDGEILTSLVRLPLTELTGETGGELPPWQWTVNDLEENTTRWFFEGTPVVQSGRVYVAATHNRPDLAHHVVCYDSESGKMLWNRRVCSAISPVEPEFHQLGHQLLTLGDQMLFYSTDSGVIAALDADNGRVRWAVTYETLPAEEYLENLSSDSTHGLLPCLYHQGLVIAAPNDSEYLWGIEARSGIVRWRVRLPDRIRHLLGVNEGRLIVSGNSLWALDVNTGRRLWGDGGTDPEYYGYGRGLLVGEAIWWPTRNQIHRISQQTGQPIDQPINLAAKGGTGGNLLLTDQFLVVAEAGRLVVYDEFAKVIPPADQPITARERYEQGLRHEARGEWRQAAWLYRQALNGADQDENPALCEAIRGQFLDATLKAVPELLDQGETATAMQMLREAEQGTTDLESRWRALRELARVHRLRNEPDQALAVYRQALQDNSLAAFRLADQREQTVEAVARRETLHLLESFGRDSYRTLDLTARREFARLKENGTTEELARLCRCYPAASQLGEMRLELARRHRREGNPRRALEEYRQAAQALSAPEPRADCLREWIGLLESEGLHGEAERLAWEEMRWLLRDLLPWNGQVAGPSAALPEHGLLTGAEYAAQQALTAGRLSYLQPLWDRKLSASARIHVPRRAPPAARYLGALIEEETLRFVQLASGQTLWERRSPPLVAAEFHGDLLALVTETELEAVTLERGMTWWKYVFPESASFARPLRSDQPFPPRLLVDEAGLYCLHPRLGALRIDPATGELVWRLALPGRIQPHWALHGEHLIVQTLNPAEVLLIRASDGRPVEQFHGESEAFAADPVWVEPGHFAWVNRRNQLRLFSAGQEGPLFQQRDFHQSNGLTVLLPASADWPVDSRTLSALADGQALHQLDGHGRELWKRTVATRPLSDAVELLERTETGLFVVSEGILRRFAVADGALLWEQPLELPAARWRTLVRGELGLAFPVGFSEPQSQFPVILFRPATGEIFQRLLLPAGEASPAEAHAAGAYFLWRSGRRLLACGPRMEWGG